MNIEFNTAELSVGASCVLMRDDVQEGRNAVTRRPLVVPVLMRPKENEE